MSVMVHDCCTLSMSCLTQDRELEEFYDAFALLANMLDESQSKVCDMACLCKFFHLRLMLSIVTSSSATRRNTYLQQSSRCSFAHGVQTKWRTKITRSE